MDVLLIKGVGSKVISMLLINKDFIYIVLIGRWQNLHLTPKKNIGAIHQ